MKKKREKVSQQRIARDLGVSQALVSLVLNGKRENISEESYQRIWNHALKIGYRPKGMRLSGEHSGAMSVGFILRAGLRLHTQSNFFSHVQHGLHAGLLERGYHSIFLGAEDDLGLHEVRKILRRHELTGLAVLGQVGLDFIKEIRAVQPNVVTISATYPGLCHSVMPNEMQAIEQLVTHLTELDHKQFAWIGGDQGLDYNLRRHRALETALTARNLKLAQKYSVDVATGDRLAGWKAAEIFMAQLGKKSHPTACICGNGSVARGFVSGLLQRGWRVPDQVTVVAVDATRICTEEYPEITGAHADPEKIGTTAAEILLKSAADQNGILSDLVLPTQLTIRQTSGKAPA